MKKENGYDLRKACNFIIENAAQDEEKPEEGLFFSHRDKKFAKLILKAMELKVDPEAFRVHSKGQGLICIK
jgi:hypothetical protein